VEELGEITKIQNEFEKKGLVLLAVTHDDEKMLRDFYAINSVGFKPYRDIDSSTHKAYGIDKLGIPCTFIIDKEGRLSAFIFAGTDATKLREAIRLAGIDR
jgi:peroxiredoxin